MKKIYLAVSIGMLVACTADKGDFPVAITYDCQQGQYFTMSYSTAESVSTSYLNETRILKRQPSASGAQYHDLKGNTALYTKGDEALLEWDLTRLEGCMVRE